jgi:hypothetical protein
MKTDIVFPFVGTILSIPVFLHGLTQLMTLVTSFVADVFAGEKKEGNNADFFSHSQY